MGEGGWEMGDGRFSPLTSHISHLTSHLYFRLTFTAARTTDSPTFSNTLISPDRSVAKAAASSVITLPTTNFPPAGMSHPAPTVTRGASYLNSPAR